MKSKTLGLLIVMVMVVLSVVPVGAAPAPVDNSSPVSNDTTPVEATSQSDPGELGVYIVLLKGASLAAYEGGIAGLEATSPATTGEAKLDVSSPASVAYLDYLAGQHAQVVDEIEQALDRSVDVLYRYDVVLNGMAVRMTGAEAVRVAKLPGVKGVQQETIEYPDTDVGPTWIGAPGIWDGSAVPGGVGTEGEGVIVGVIDTGINHDHPSFADVGGDGYDHTNPWGSGTYVGYCVANPSFCNDKLIGAWNYTDGPEDTDGHGSHTSSTAAGNHITATITTPSGYVVETPISGVAPHANIVMYDACSTGCPGAGLLAAVNQAVADGVDVINYSISGGNNPYGDSVELAFLDANTAGVFVSTSAGNNGPAPSTVAHRSPWVSTVAAATHNRLYTNQLANMTGGDTTPPADITGQSISTGYGPADIVYAGDYGNALCADFGGVVFSGEIVVCDRGTYGRVEKGQNVLNAGGGGYVLANDAANGDSLVADPHVLPAIHITYSDGVALKAWMASGTGHVATITETGMNLDPNNGDIMASFSSRGPNTTFDVLKPDMSAPGVAILAAYMNGIELTWLGGTSMSSPHNAGAGALMKALYPSWSPSEIKSAIMSTAWTTNLRKEDGVTPADPFDVGAGRDNLMAAALAGVVFDETRADYLAANPASGGDPKTLNVPSLQDSNCEGTCSWTREVKSTQSGTVTWTASGTGMGFTFSPATFDLPAGGTQEIVITADVTGLPVGSWSFGEVTLTPSAGTAIPEAHLPVAVIAQPALVDPVIGVDPESFDTTQGVDTVTVHPLTISNDGGSLLEWDIFEDGTASAVNLVDWSDNFDSYGTDVSLHGLGGWKGWFNDPAATAYTRDEQAISTPNSAEIAGASDLVHEYSGYTSGVWRYTAWQYIPTGTTGETYFILLNQYDDAGTNLNWSTQVNFNNTTGQVVNEGSSAGQLPIVYDQWVEIRVDIDLNNDVQRFYYDGDLLFEGTWTNEQSGGGILNIGAVDLFANSASSVYYDDLSLVETGWSDNFDSYATDLSLHGVGGWKGWGNLPAATAYTRDEQAHSTPNSVEIVNVSDLVHEYTGYTSGQWTYTAWQYIPTAFTGESYFILLNQYDDAGATNNWSTQINFNGATNQVVNDGPAAGTLPLVRGQWMEIRVEIDLDNDIQSFYYGGDLLFTGSWTEGLSGGGILNIGAVDLWGNNASAVYYDDMSLAEAQLEPGICDAPSEIPWVSVAPTSGSTPVGDDSIVDVSFDSTGLTVGETYTGTLCVNSNDPVNPIVPVPLTLNVVSGEPDISVDPEALSADVCVDGMEVVTVTVCNTGTLPLDWTLTEIEPVPTRGSSLPAAPTADSRAGGTVELSLEAVPASDGSVLTSPPAVDADVSLVLDDGTNENNIGIGGTLEFIYLNRFTPDQALYPFVIDEIQVYFDSGGLAQVGHDIILVAYENTTGNTDPAVGSNWLASFPTTVQAVDDWNVYDISAAPVLFEGPGDVLIGVVALETPGTSYWPAALDQTVSQQRSWAGWWASSPPPTPPLLPPTANWTLIDAYFPGNWLVRGYGEEVEMFDIPWLSEDPLAGTVQPGECQEIAVTFDATGMMVGDYAGALLLESNDPDTPEITIPVTMTVLEPVAITNVTYTADALEVTFDATVTGTAPFDYVWDFGDGNTSTEEDPVHVYDAGGYYTVTFAVSNGCSADAWSEQIFVCEPVSGLDFSWLPAMPIVDEEVTFTASATGTEPITFDWDFGDGATGTGITATHTYTAAGDYLVTVTAMNCGEASEVMTHTVTVETGKMMYYLPIVFRNHD